MSFIDTNSIKVALRDQFSPARAKKAYSAGVAGGIAGVGASFTFGGLFADGKLDGTEIVGVGSAFVGGFVLAFLGAWLPTQNTQAPRKQKDALTYGDGLADPANTAAPDPDEPKHAA